MAIDLLALINFTSPGAASSVRRAPDGVEGDPWPGIDTWTADDYQAATETLVKWVLAPVTGAVLHANVAAYLASLPTAEQQADSQRDSSATITLNTPLNKALRDIFWDIEVRLRAAGQASGNPDIAAAATKAAYAGVLKNIVKGYET